MQNISRLSMASQYLDAQIKTLETFGFSKEMSLKSLNVNQDDIDNKYNRFSILKLIDLYKRAATDLNDPLISLRVGFAFRVSTFQKTGNIYTVCDNIRQVVHMNEKYQRLAIYAGHASLVSEADRSYLHFESFDLPRDGRDHIINLIFGAYGSAFRWLNWGSGKGLKAIELQQAAPTDLSLFEKVFDCPVRFDSPHNRLEFFEEHIDLPLPTRDPLKRAKFEAKLDYLMANESYSETLLIAVHHCLIKQMKQGIISFKNTAEDMQLSETKLRQALEKAGTSFRIRVDYARIEEFKRLQKDGKSFAAIAQSLAYNDQAAFSRAFKRWYGVAPGQWTPETDLLSEFATKSAL